MKKSFILSILVFIVSVVLGQDAKVNQHQENLTGPFNSPQEVTQACLECHEEVGDEIIASRHWNWAEAPDSVAQGKVNLGKKNIINNFCIAVPSNYPRCTSCHIGYGWKDASFDFTKKENIDCLVCHDQTSKYSKDPKGAGMPKKDIDLLEIAQNVGPTNRENCGNCHFYGGGDEGVKHGDMDGSLLNPTADFDVHMGGQDFSCAECHTTENHAISGKSHGSRFMGTGTEVKCASCHEGEIHKKKILNKHTKNIACQTCHIPTYAKEIPTKIWWDWSTAGSKAEAKNDEFGKPDFVNKKGHFKRGKNLVPEYKWYNGSSGYYLLGDKIDATKRLELNPLIVTIADKDAKIAPFKVMVSKQPYDAERNILVVPKLFGKDGYWKTYDWNDAIAKGMKEVGKEYSGKLGWVETEMNWPINHMVVPAKKALKCNACHGKKATRLNWEALGYPGDPKKVKAGREKLGLLK
jgi:octaheme c-type cytochrome (tetrathionate reductase family)